MKKPAQLWYTCHSWAGHTSEKGMIPPISTSVTGFLR